MLPEQYSRFNDPFGLAWRLIRSGQREAIWGLCLPLLELCATPLDVLLAGLMRHDRIEAFGPTTSNKAPVKRYPILFIIGAPRSGTTLVHQVLARHLDVSYFSNAVNMFPRSVLGIGGLIQRRQKAQNISYRSHYGTSAALAGPNDGFSIWNRWLGSDRYSAPYSIDDRTSSEIRRFFDSWFEKLPKPFLNKNNRHVDCAIALSKALPEAFFLEVRRDPVSVAQSLLRAREYIQGDVQRPWGLHSDQFDSPSLDAAEQVCRQINSVYQRLTDARINIDPKRYRVIEFESFCANPAAHVESLRQSIQSVSLRPSPPLTDLKPFARPSLVKSTSADVERDRLTQILKSIDIDVG